MMAVTCAGRDTRGFFDGLGEEPADALLALIGMHARDARPGKIDLGVGMFRNDAGATPVLRAVKLAEKELLDDEPTKSYLGAEGDEQFVALLTPILFGAQPAMGGYVRGVQTPGGTGALRLAFDLVAQGNPDATVWVGTPTWANHLPLIAAAGLKSRTHRLFDSVRGTIDFDAAITALGEVAAGDVVLLHGCCHNPTGADFTQDEWQALRFLLERRGAIPLIDLAYQGLGDGLDEDAAGMRTMVAGLSEAIVAYSCDKNFGLYRERVGGLWIKAASQAGARLAFGKMLSLARTLWSMPPSHGAAVVRIILDSPELTGIWARELTDMRSRINRLRALLASAHPRLAPLAGQKGMFATLPLMSDDILTLRERDGIYMAGSGRINIAGLRDETVPAFAQAACPFFAKQLEG